MRVELPKMNDWTDEVFGLHNEKDLPFIALRLFQFQFEQNPLYHDYCRALGRTPDTVRRLEDIPFLPISFFKSHRIATTRFEHQALFESSGTTGTIASRHYVRETGLYERSFTEAFRLFYGDVRDYCILGLLPSYLERGQSSLVYMVDRLIRDSGHPESGFYLHDRQKLNDTLHRLEAAGQKTLLIGVTYALLYFSADWPQQLRHTIVMETGGMKGRGRELTRAELHAALRAGFGVDEIHAEYGMTELLSQAYAIDGRFQTPPWMQIQLRDETDPFDLLPRRAGVSGGMNIIDLANIYSCAFIATEDIGRWLDDGCFEVLGRMDHSDIRGCSLLTV